MKLYVTSADADALKVLIASSAYGAELDPKVLSQFRASSLKLTPGKFPCLEVESGKGIFGANAIVRYLSLTSASPVKALAGLGLLDGESWTEWEETSLAPVLNAFFAAPEDASKKEAVIAQLGRLERALSSRKFLSGDAYGVSDIVVWSDIGTAVQSGSLSSVTPAVSAWVKTIAAEAAFTSGSQALTKLAATIPKPAVRGPRIPRDGERNILITSALPYVNNVPHLGNIIGCVLSADVFARYCRLRGYNAIFICGTDEYGTATETKAQEMRVTPREICDKYHAIHAEIYKWFDLSFDKFGRTSNPLQTTISQDIFLKVHDKKLLLEQEMEQLFCDKSCNKFLADRFAEGTCPYCNYEDARGDQCDKCGKLLNPTELKNPRCKTCQQPPIVRRTQHLFLDLPEISPRLREWIDKASVKGFWSSNSLMMTNAWLRDGLKPRCLTRDLKWGVPVPIEKFKDKVLYVWFDAPIGYISITANYTPEWDKWWKNPDQVELFQFMGKDNVPFHTVIFPASLLASGEQWTLLHHISTTEYLNYENGKFSKSRGVGVFGDDARGTGIPVEVWRYYLLINRPEQSDSVFTWADFAAKCNNELLANIGNFVNRILSFIANKLDGKIPPLDESKLTDKDKELIAEVTKEVGEYINELEKVHIKDGLKIAMGVSRLGNLYMQDSKPWAELKTDRRRCETVVRICASVVKLVATLMFPYMPSFSTKVLQQLNLDHELEDGGLRLDPNLQLLDLLETGHEIGKPTPIFQEISDAQVAALREKFAGRQQQEAPPAKPAPAAAPVPTGKAPAK